MGRGGEGRERERRKGREREERGYSPSQISILGADIEGTGYQRLCGGYNYDSTGVRREFDCLSEVIKCTVT